MPNIGEEIAAMKCLNESFSREGYNRRDMPEGTIVTEPYYTDLNVLVALK